MKLGWKSITGAVVAAVGYLAQPDVLAVLPHKVASVITAAGGVLAVFGVRHAIDKAARGY